MADLFLCCSMNAARQCCCPCACPPRHASVRACGDGSRGLTAVTSRPLDSKALVRFKRESCWSESSAHAATRWRAKLAHGCCCEQAITARTLARQEHRRGGPASSPETTDSRVVLSNLPAITGRGMAACALASRELEPDARVLGLESDRCLKTCNDFDRLQRL